MIKSDILDDLPVYHVQYMQTFVLVQTGTLGDLGCFVAQIPVFIINMMQPHAVFMFRILICLGIFYFCAVFTFRVF